MTVVMIVAYSISGLALLFAFGCMIDTHRILREIERDTEQWNRMMGYK